MGTRSKIIRVVLFCVCVLITGYIILGKENKAEVQLDSRTTAILELAEKYELITSSKYADIEKRLKEENKRRQKALTEGKVIYGPTEYTMEMYIKYLCSNLEPVLIEKMTGEEISCTEEDIKLYYEQHKTEIAVMPETMLFYEISASMANEKYMKEICESDNPVEFAEQYKDYVQVSKTEFQNNSVVYNRNPELMEQLSKLDFGEWTNILDIGDKKYIYVCLEKNSEYILPYKKVRETVKNMYLKREFETYLEQKTYE